MAKSTRSLVAGFLRSAARFPDRPALQLADTTWSYAQTLAAAQRMAAALDAHAPAAEGPLCAVFGHRTLTVYAAVLAALLRGRGYVPLNPAFPTDRTRAMLQRAGCRSVIVDRNAVEQLPEVLAEAAPGLVLLLPDHTAGELVALRARWPQHRLLGAEDLVDAAPPAPPEVPNDQLAYVLFTSGSTGQPKGVMVAQRNVTAFVDAMVERYRITEHDRLSQTFDLTFDLSAFDMFVAWERGACLCAPTQSQKTLPARYIQECGITVWFSVPSTAVLMNRLRLLKPGRYPSLRLSLFCGEALPMEIVQRWAEAAPHSVVENLYGPTELTIACTLYRWDAAHSPAQCEQGVVPIGDPYPGMQVLVADEQLREVAPGETGELLMTGPQLSLGYLNDPSRTAAAFVVPPGREEVFYRTGDRVRRPQGDQPMVYLGRIDNQIKIQGYRVELGEIEAIARQQSGAGTAIAVGWPVTPSGADGVVCFIDPVDEPLETVRARINAHLPGYMQAAELRTVANWPLNSNGKVDRKVLRDSLEAAPSAPPGGQD